MNRLTLCILVLVACATLSACTRSAPSTDPVAAVNRIMKEQEEAWNRGDLEAFMQGYWKSDSLQFIGSRGISRGWERTLEGYKRGYPTVEAMGQLRFEILQRQPVAPDAMLVTGKFFLTRSMGDLSGIFTLLFQVKDGKWVIVYDHTS